MADMRLPMAWPIPQIVLVPRVVGVWLGRLAMGSAGTHNVIWTNGEPQTRDGRLAGFPTSRLG